MREGAASLCALHEDGILVYNPLSGDILDVPRPEGCREMWRWFDDARNMKKKNTRSANLVCYSEGEEDGSCFWWSTRQMRRTS